MIGHRGVVLKSVMTMIAALLCRVSPHQSLSTHSGSRPSSPLLKASEFTPLQPPLYLITKIRDDGRNDVQMETATIGLEQYLRDHLGPEFSGSDPNHPRLLSTMEFEEKVKSCEWYPCEEIVETVTQESDGKSVVRLTIDAELVIVPEPRHHTAGKPLGHESRMHIVHWPCDISNDRTPDKCRRDSKLDIEQALHDHEARFHQRKEPQ